MAFEQYKVWILFKIKTEEPKIVRGKVLLFSHRVSVGEQVLRFWGREMGQVFSTT